MAGEERDLTNRDDSRPVRVKVDNVKKIYNTRNGEMVALNGVTLDIHDNEFICVVGPSGCGKSTYLKTLNRMNDLVPNVKIEGTVLLDGEDIYDPQVDTTLLRKKVGMVFQQPNPFPMSIYDNVAYGPRIHGIKNKAQLDEIVERSLKGAALWDEVSDRLKKSALGLSGGQQQRVAIARAVVTNPKLILADEPTGNVDPEMSHEIIELLNEINATGTTVIVVTHEHDLVREFDRRVVVLDHGKIKSDTKDLFVKDDYTDDYGDDSGEEENTPDYPDNAVVVPE